MPQQVSVSVPATTANLGPGFDCLGLALDLWNHALFSLEGDQIQVDVNGEGAGELQNDADNLIARAALRLFESAGAPTPAGLLIRCVNHIPLTSGLGSSAAATLAGLLGANALLGAPYSNEAILGIAAKFEGHPDNIAPALLGGLVLSAQVSTEKGDGAGSLITHRVPVADFKVALVIPDVALTTQQARAALPAQVPLGEAVFNIGRAALVVEALRTGDLELLKSAMDDRLHQPYRLKLIPGGEEALRAARQAGAAAALSGAGPGVIAFTHRDAAPIAAAMAAAFSQAGVPVRSFSLGIATSGARVRFD
jgi:homoserine kinase